jgi:hypothetical protein
MYSNNQIVYGRLRLAFGSITFNIATIAATLFIFGLWDFLLKKYTAYLIVYQLCGCAGGSNILLMTISGISRGRTNPHSSVTDTNVNPKKPDNSFNRLGASIKSLSLHKSERSRKIRPEIILSSLDNGDFSKRLSLPSNRNVLLTRTPYVDSTNPTNDTLDDSRTQKNLLEIHS